MCKPKLPAFRAIWTNYRRHNSSRSWEWDQMKVNIRCILYDSIIYTFVYIYIYVHTYVYIRMYTPFLIWKLDHSALSCPLSCLWLVQVQLDTGSVLLNITGPHWLLSIFPVILSEKVQLEAVGPKHKRVQCPPTSRDGCVVMLQSHRSINPSFLFF